MTINNKIDYINGQKYPHSLLLNLCQRSKIRYFKFRVSILEYMYSSLFSEKDSFPSWKRCQIWRKIIEKIFNIFIKKE